MLDTHGAEVDDPEGFRGRTDPANQVACSWESSFLPQKVLTGIHLSLENTESSYRKTASPGSLNGGTSKASKLDGLDHSLL